MNLTTETSAEQSVPTPDCAHCFVQGIKWLLYGFLVLVASVGAFGGVLFTQLLSGSSLSTFIMGGLLVGVVAGMGCYVVATGKGIQGVVGLLNKRSASRREIVLLVVFAVLWLLLPGGFWAHVFMLVVMGVHS